MDSFFFWHHTTTAAERHLMAAFAFASSVLLFVVWRRRSFRWVAVLPAAVCVVLWVSILLEPDRTRDAVVVIDGAILRSADSAGAPAALDAPLPAGVEVRVAEERGDWARVVLPGGAQGWIPRTSVARVAEPLR